MSRPAPAKTEIPVRWKHLDALLARGDRVLEASIEGAGRDGGPTCATVPLAREWRVAAKERR